MQVHYVGGMLSQERACRRGRAGRWLYSSWSCPCCFFYDKYPLTRSGGIDSLSHMRLTTRNWSSFASWECLKTQWGGCPSLSSFIPLRHVSNSSSSRWSCGLTMCFRGWVVAILGLLNLVWFWRPGPDMTTECSTPGAVVWLPWQSPTTVELALAARTMNFSRTYHSSVWFNLKVSVRSI